MNAAEAGHQAVCDYLLSHGADVGATDGTGEHCGSTDGIYLALIRIGLSQSVLSHCLQKL